MKRPLFALMTAVACALAASPTWADGLASLQAFVQQAKAGTATFKQVVTSPAKEGQESGRVQTSRGQFSFQRPGQFKFIYTQPFAQSIVADGQTLWLYDEDLEQVTQRRQDDVLAGTPAALLTSVSDMAALERDFVLSSQPEQDGLQWVLATPKQTDGQLQSLRVGFEGEKLAALEMLDSFGQRSELRFEQVQLMPSLPAQAFVFEPPPGVDVLRH